MEWLLEKELPALASWGKERMEFKQRFVFAGLLASGVISVAQALSLWAALGIYKKEGV